jgi:hypothetical protein
MQLGMVWIVLCFLLACAALVGLCVWVARKLEDFHL